MSVKRGMPFTDGELVKSCLITAAEEMCPEKKQTCLKLLAFWCEELL